MASTTRSRKPRGFWQASGTLDVLRLFIQGKISEEEAARRLQCGSGDVRYHARSLRRSASHGAELVSVRLSGPAADRLRRTARITGRSVGETATMLLSEKLREEEFPFIEFRTSPMGRLPFVKGTSLAVWEVVLVGRQLKMDPGRTADYLQWPDPKVRSALAYAETYRDEVEPLVEEAEGIGYEELRRKVPWVREVRV